MSGYTGVLKIVRFNWPWYAAAVLITAALSVVITLSSLLALGHMLAWALIAFADGWLLVSLAVSHYVYDRSAVARGGWLDGETAGQDPKHVAIFHLGQDEASAHTTRLLPSATILIFDVYHSEHSGSPSLARARQLAVAASTPAVCNQLPLADGSIDFALVIFAAHELRDDGVRADFFRELARIIGPRGRALVVEHLRDGWNFCAYGPGFFHFLGRRTWLRTFAQAGLQVTQESRMTPWVRRFELTKLT